MRNGNVNNEGSVKAGASDPSILELDCSKCGASLNLDMDNLIKYCPYCGHKILVDPVAFKEILIEKEKTKRQSMEYEQENLVRREKYARRPEKVKASIVLACIGIGMILLGGFMEGVSENPNIPWYMLTELGLFPLIAIPWIWLIDATH